MNFYIFKIATTWRHLLCIYNLIFFSRRWSNANLMMNFNTLFPLHTKYEVVIATC